MIKSGPTFDQMSSGFGRIRPDPAGSGWYRLVCGRFRPNLAGSGWYRPALPAAAASPPPPEAPSAFLLVEHLSRNMPWLGVTCKKSGSSPDPAGSGRIQAGSGCIWPAYGRMRPDLAGSGRIRPNPAENRPDLGRSAFTWPDSLRPGRNLLESGRARLDLARIWPPR